MLVTADDVARSLRGTVALLNRRVEALTDFDMSEAGFWRSFGAIWLTLPSFVVFLALERHRLGLLDPGSPLIDLSWVTLTVAVGHVATFLALPVAMIWVARRLGLTHRYAPFVIVWNWVAAVSLAVLCVPGVLHLIGWAPAQLAAFFAACSLVVLARIHWFAAKATLGVSGVVAAAIVGLGLVLNLLIAGTVDALAG